MPVVQSIVMFNFPGGRHVSRPVAILLLVGSVLLAVGLFFFFGLPPVIRDARQFGTDLPKRIPLIVDKLKGLPMADKFGVDDIVARTEGAISGLARYLFDSAPKWLAHIFDVLTSFILCVYFMLEGEHAYHYFLSLFCVEDRIRLNATLEKAEMRMSKWLIGQGTLMLILGVCSVIVFGLLHVRYFVMLGLLMGLLNIIPIAGGVITIVAVAAVAALDSVAKMSGVLIFYLIYVNIENAYLTPRIMRTSVNLMGLTVLVGLLVGTAVAGVVGALVSVPTAALIAVLMDEYLVKKDWK